jgi:hypothetical protein
MRLQSLKWGSGALVLAEVPGIPFEHIVKKADKISVYQRAPGTARQGK